MGVKIWHQNFQGIISLEVEKGAIGAKVGDKNEGASESSLKGKMSREKGQNL